MRPLTRPVVALLALGLVLSLSAAAPAVHHASAAASPATHGDYVVCDPDDSCPTTRLRVEHLGGASATSPRSAGSASSGAITRSTHRLYVAAVTNVGRLDANATLSSRLASVRSYWVSQSGGYITSFVQPRAIVRYTSAVATTGNGCGLGRAVAMWTEARRRFAGVDFTRPGNHLMVVIPRSCVDLGYGAGIGTVGSNIDSGGWSIVAGGEILGATAEHELGHNFSLEHANATTDASSGHADQYYDIYSPMGFAVSGGSWTAATLDSARRVELGITARGEVPAVPVSRDITIRPRTAGSGVRGLRITDPRTHVTYFVDYRAGVGADSTSYYTRGLGLAPAYLYRPGIVVTRFESDDSTTLLTYRSGSTSVTSWAAGQTMSVGALHIVVRSLSPTAGAQLTVLVDGTTPTAGRPATLAIATPRISGTARIGSRLVAAAGSSLPTARHVAYQWYANGVAISHATASSFVLGAAQDGKRLTVRVTGTRPGYTAAAAVSAATTAVRP